MRILITGGAGFIGSHLADACITRGDQVFVLDDLSTGRRENVAQLANDPRFHLIVGSVEESIKRGTVQVALRCQRRAAPADFQLNRVALRSYRSFFERLLSL